MLLLKKWHILKELITVLQVPYKGTIALQRRSLTLSDAYGIWQKMGILLNTVDMQRICRTNFRQCLIDALNRRYIYTLTEETAYYTTKKRIVCVPYHLCTVNI